MQGVVAAWHSGNITTVDNRNPQTLACASVLEVSSRLAHVIARRHRVSQRLATRAPQFEGEGARHVPC